MYLFFLMPNFSTDERNPRIIPSFPELINSCMKAPQRQSRPWNNHLLYASRYGGALSSSAPADSSIIPKSYTKIEPGGIYTAGICNSHLFNVQTFNHLRSPVFSTSSNRQSQSNPNNHLIQKLHIPTHITNIKPIDRVKTRAHATGKMLLSERQTGNQAIHTETAERSDHGILSFTVKPTGAQNHDNKLIESFPHHLNKGLSTRNFLNCCHCGSTKTPEWRSGPKGNRTLCNACGLFYSKLVKKCGRSVAYKKFIDRKKRGKANDRRITSFD